ncbi:L-histidine N(alpha)-methyltransferase [Dyella agri]
MAFERDVIAGLSARPKTLSPKYLYDARGSALFEEICHTPEYYPTRTETALLRSAAAEIADDVPTGSVLVEFGSGASTKTRLLLDATPQIHAYVAVEISADAVSRAMARLTHDYPDLLVHPIVADFTEPFDIPDHLLARVQVGFFPGSTIGNFSREGAIDLLHSLRDRLGPASRLVVGADLVKNEEALLAAYDDEEGLTSSFNKNLLQRINRELGGDFDISLFAHSARWNAREQRIEMHLVSLQEQTVHIAGTPIAFAAGESIHTENSQKFTGESFRALARAAGWSVRRSWISDNPAFAVFELCPTLSSS